LSPPHTQNFHPPTVTFFGTHPSRTHTTTTPEFFFFFNFTNREELLAYVNALQAQVESDSRSISVSRDGVAQLDVDQVHPQSIGDGEWSDIQATDSRISDVREIMSEATGTSLEIPVITLPVDDHREHDGNSFH
ncbi:hypothetical protein IFM89_018128, partial [Coptis chinensis]